MQAKRILVERANRMHIVRRSLRVILILLSCKKYLARPARGALTEKNRSKYRRVSIFRMRLLELSLFGKFQVRWRRNMIDKYVRNFDMELTENIYREKNFDSPIIIIDGLTNILKILSDHRSSQNLLLYEYI